MTKMVAREGLLDPRFPPLLGGRRRGDGFRQGDVPAYIARHSRARGNPGADVALHRADRVHWLAAAGPRSMQVGAESLTESLIEISAGTTNGCLEHVEWNRPRKAIRPAGSVGKAQIDASPAAAATIRGCPLTTLVGSGLTAAGLGGGGLFP